MKPLHTNALASIIISPRAFAGEFSNDDYPMTYDKIIVSGKTILYSSGDDGALRGMDKRNEKIIGKYDFMCIDRVNLVGGRW